MELYVHIPFCVRKCAYCDFLSGPADEETRAAYVDALLREIRSAGAFYSRKNESGKERGRRVETVFLGGGTPSILEGEDTARIFSALRECFFIAPDAEITMEANPGTVTREKAEVWKACGINRLSIGLQSADDEELKLLGRIHTYRDFLNTWETVREAGFTNVNVDLISAVPGQTAESWEQTLRRTAELGPGHISAYSLIVEEGTPFFEKYGEPESNGENLSVKHGDSSEEENGGLKIAGSVCQGVWPPLPDEEEERKMYDATLRILKEYGYHRYEISNYAKEGYECRHNLGYWERKEYLGLGLGASSLIGEHRFRNTADMNTYLSCSEKLIREEEEILSVKDQMEEFMFLGLRKTAGVTEEAFKSAFGTAVSDVYGKQISRLKSQGLLEQREGRIFLTERGTDISNYVFGEFLF